MGPSVEFPSFAGFVVRAPHAAARIRAFDMSWVPQQDMPHAKPYTVRMRLTIYSTRYRTHEMLVVLTVAEDQEGW